MKDVKISEVFNLPMRAENEMGRVFIADDDYLVFEATCDSDGISLDTRADTAAHAINSHDQLAEHNKILVEALKSTETTLHAILDDPEVMNVYKCHIDEDDLEEIQAAIAHTNAMVRVEG